MGNRQERANTHFVTPGIPVACIAATGAGLLKAAKPMTASTLTPPTGRAGGDYMEQVITSVKAKNPAEPEFHQA